MLVTIFLTVAIVAIVAVIVTVSHQRIDRALDTVGKVFELR